MKEKLTYFTPTYNRAYILGNLYKCLINQTNKDFIWLIIDDGSTDNTNELVTNWQKENKIKIEYYKKENGGKNTAIDMSNEVCKTDYITCIDSDDYIANNCTEILYNYFKLIDDKDDVAGLLCLKRNLVKNNQEVDYSKFIKDKEIINFYDLYENKGFNGETMLVFKTEIAKKYKFPIIKDERFITESVYYKQFLYDYKLMTIDAPLYFFEYIDDGYTNQGFKLFLRNPRGFLYFLKQEAFYSIKRSKLKTRIGNCARFYAWKKILKIDFQQLNDYKIPFFYYVFGNIFKHIFLKRYKKEYNSFNKNK